MIRRLSSLMFVLAFGLLLASGFPHHITNLPMMLGGAFLGLCAGLIEIYRRYTGIQVALAARRRADAGGEGD